MARKTDESRIERIRQVAQQMVVEQGFGGASVSAIARKAGVAEGYLYRFYPGKADLVNDLLFSSLNELADRLEKILDDNHSLDEILGCLLDSLFQLAQENPDRIKFLYVLMHDYNFRIQAEQRDRIFNLCNRLIQKGKDSGKLRDQINEEQIFLLAVAYPIQFINLRLKGFFYKSGFGDSDKETITNICIHALKKTA